MVEDITIEAMPQVMGTLICAMLTHSLWKMGPEPQVEGRRRPSSRHVVHIHCYSDLPAKATCIKKPSQSGSRGCTVYQTNKRNRH